MPEYWYAWIGLRLAGGTAAIPVLQKHLAALAADLQRQEQQVTHRNVIGTSFGVNRSDLLAALPAAIAARTRPAIELRTE
jgi:hypothetical protein